MKLVCILCSLVVLMSCQKENFTNFQKAPEGWYLEAKVAKSQFSQDVRFDVQFKDGTRLTWPVDVKPNQERVRTLLMMPEKEVKYVRYFIVEDYPPTK
jgi:hypothetical protein